MDDSKNLQQTATSIITLKHILIRVATALDPE